MTQQLLCGNVCVWCYETHEHIAVSIKGKIPLQILLHCYTINLGCSVHSKSCVTDLLGKSILPTFPTFLTLHIITHPPPYSWLNTSCGCIAFWSIETIIREEIGLSACVFVPMIVNSERLTPKPHILDT